MVKTVVPMVIASMQKLSHPYFVKQLEKPTTDDIDLRMCRGNGIFFEDVALELVEIYIE